MVLLLGLLLIAYLDDVPGEHISYAIDKLMNAGAKAVYVVPSIGKKGRMGYLVFIDIDDESKLDNVVRTAVEDLGSLGIKVLRYEHIATEFRIHRVRVTIGRRTVGEVRVKIVEVSGRAIYAKAEFEDVKNVVEALGGSVSLSLLRKIIETAALRGEEVVNLENYGA